MIGDKIMVVLPYIYRIEEATSRGPGAYPYECISKDKFPNDEIYYFENYGWVSERDLIYSYEWKIFHFEGWSIPSNPEFKEMYERVIVSKDS